MTNFVLLYTGGTMPESEAEQQQVMADWGAWYGQLGDDIVDGGNPFNNARTVTADGISDGPATAPGVTGYTVISADSIDDAVSKVKSHPHIKHGGQISVHETFKM